ncbi:hypothetical protein EV178_002261 [Coemansia sp. RSA 1646]|nr:hypothetical protein EV178_002261 [Coemansia sp. RSA 1646]KAJ2090021.1 hypothetical protein IW138_002990 [Coemansia sp. RSA 986]
MEMVDKASSSSKSDEQLPEISVQAPDGASSELITTNNKNETSDLENTSPTSSPDSPALSYLHTPAEPYDGEAVSGSSQAALTRFLQTTGLTDQLGTAESSSNDVSLDAVAATLQAEISTATMSHRSIWYLVARNWYAAWQEYASGLVQDRTIGPIDNSSIVDDAGHILPGLRLDKEVDAVPEAAWIKLSNLYGLLGSSISIRRMAIQNNGGSTILDLYPPSVFVTPKTSNAAADQKNTRRIEISLDAPVSELKWRISHAFGLSYGSGACTLRLYCSGRPTNTSRTALSSESQEPPSYESAIATEESADANPEALIADDSSSLISARILPDAAIIFEVVHAAGNGETAIVADNSSRMKFTASTFEPRYKKGSSITKSTSSATSRAIATTRLDRKQEAYGSDSSPQSPGSDSGSDADVSAAATGSTFDSSMMVVAAPLPQVHYRCGLVNLGNTCFMNSALQCLGHFSDLTKYFVSNVYTSELNRDNPLGMKGAVASAYGRLAKAMWDTGRGSFAPRAFKQTIGQWAPQFRGYNQQDAPEFLASLLDGMHEDLNRIIRKPYIEIPDSNGRPDTEVADERWNIYKQRDDSVIVDLFQGQYRSTLVCPECDNVSVTFDPFMYLTLPLPVQRQKWLELLFIPADPILYPLHMYLLVKNDDFIKQLRKLVGHLVQRNPDNLLVCEMLSMRIYSVYEDTDPLGEIGDSDVIHIYEIGVDVTKVTDGPSSTPLPVVQLLCSRANVPSPYGGRRYTYGPDVVSKPLLLTLPKSELALGELYHQITLALSRWTTVDISKIIVQLEGAFSDNETTEASERLLELLGKAASLSIHRAEPAPRMQQRNLSFISSYTYTGKRSFGPTSVFRAFEDRLTYDNCRPLVNKVAKQSGEHADNIIPGYGENTVDSQEKQPLASGNSSSSSSSDDGEKMPANSSGLVPTSEECVGRRRARPADDMDIYFSKPDNNLDSDTRAAAYQAASKRARSDNGSDCDSKDPVDDGISPSFVSAAESLAPAAPIANSTAEDGVNAQPAVAVDIDTDTSVVASAHSSIFGDSATPTGLSPQRSTALETEDKPSNENGSCDDEMVAATAALSFSDLLCNKIELKTGDTLLCEWNEEGLKALVSELQGDAGPGAIDVVSTLFDFNCSDACAMPVLEDATQFKSVEPFGLTSLREMPRVAQDPSRRRDMNDQRKVTLDECLSEFMRSEKLGEDDPWYCSKCKEHQQATKKFDLWRVPEILVVHLKRFQHSRAWRDKIDTYVDFPLSDLDLKQTVVGPKGKTLIYDLYSVCNHFGGLGGGHYTAYARSPDDEKWYEFEDSRVSEVQSPEDVKTSAAYMLFYRQRPSSEDGKSVGEEKIEKLIADYKASGINSPDEYAEGKATAVSLPYGNSEMEMDSEGNTSDAGDFTQNMNGLTALGIANYGSQQINTGSRSEMDDEDTPPPPDSSRSSISGRTNGSGTDSGYPFGPHHEHPFLN